MAVPLQHRGTVLGVYNLVFDTAHPGPSAEVQALLRSVGDLLGLALHQARLEQAHRRATVVQERQKMAAEVHDSLGQSLTFVKMRLPLLEDALAAGDTERALRYCSELRGEASSAHAALRGLLSELRAPMDPLGLQHALRSSAERFRRRSDTTLEVLNGLPTLELDPDRQSQVFHIVQEALNNIARHAGARHAWLRIGPEGDGQVRIEVEDDGRGVAPAAADGGSQHYGLAIMRERAVRLGGELAVSARPGGGTCVQLHFPLAAREAARATPSMGMEP